MGVSALSFLSGYSLLKWVYPSYAEKLVAGIIAGGALMAKWEATSFGAKAWIGGSVLTVAAMFGGVPTALAPALTTAGSSMKNFGGYWGGFNAQNPMTGMMHPQQGMLIQPQMQPQMRMVKKKKKENSKDSNSTSGCS